jgi:mannosyltransferase
VDDLLHAGPGQLAARAPAGIAPPLAGMAPPPAGPAPATGRRAGAARPAWCPAWLLAAGPVATLAATAWGLAARSYWGDEADTVSAVSRSLPQLARLLRHIDAVHGLYYLMLWPLARVAGTSPVVTRLPSAAAMAAAAAGVAAIAARAGSRRAAVAAGLVFAVLPSVTLQGHDARPYAAVTAATVASSYLLLRLRGDPRPRWLAAYGLSLVLAGYLQLFAMLLIPAHAVTLAGMGRGRGPLARRWLVTVMAASAAVAPVAVAGWLQRQQISWIAWPGWGAGADLVTTLAAGPAAAALLGLLAVAGVAGREPGAAGRPAASRPGRELAWLAGPWLALPPALLLAVSAADPVYNGRYLTFCLPAVALLAGAGLAVLRPPLRAVALALVVLACLPQQRADRAPGGAIEAAAAYLGAHARRGDAIVYPSAAIPPWSLAYPAGFGGLRDLSLARSAAAAGQLYAPAVPGRILQRRERGARRIWVVQMGWGRSPAQFLAPGFRLAREWAPGPRYLRVRLYVAAARRLAPGHRRHARAARE